MKTFVRLFIRVSIALVMAGLFSMQSDLKAENLTVTLEAGDYEIVDAGENQQKIEMENFGYIMTPGKPWLPARTFLIALPPGAEVTSVTMDAGATIEIEGNYSIMPAPPIAPSNNNPQLVEKFRQEWKSNYDETYSSDNPYPEIEGKYHGTGGLRKYTFVNVAFYPISYRPQSGKLFYRPSMFVSIDYDLPAADDPHILKMLADTKADDRAAEYFVNYDQAAVWYTSSENYGREKEPTGYLIITTNALLDAITTLELWKTSIGYNVNSVTIEFIQGNYSGVDLQEKIRNFLKSRYDDLYLDYVLIVGDIADIPMRQCYPNPTVSHDSFPETHPPTDYYYADLTGDWDSDGDGYYGECGEDDVDYVPELFVGRIPHSDSATVFSICQKIINFESDMSPWKGNALLLGAMSNYKNIDTTGMPRTDGAKLMERIIDDIPSGWTYTTMYEKEGINPSGYSCDLPLTHSNVTGNWLNNNYGFVNWWAHGNVNEACRMWWAWDDGNGIPTGNELGWEGFIRNIDTPLLDNDHPSIVYCCSCCNGWLEWDCLAENLIKNGAVSVVAATRVSYYTPGWADEMWGKNATIDWAFSYSLIVNNKNVGRSFYYAQIYCMYVFNIDWVSYGNMYAFNLFGDPSLVREGVLSNQPPVCILPPDQTIVVCGDSTFSFTVTGTDPDGNFSGCSMLWGDGTFSGSTWTLPTSAAGVYSAAFRCRDSFGATCTDSVRITIVDNSPPVLSFPDDTLMYVCPQTQACLSGLISDPDGQALNCTVTNGPGTIINNSWCYTPTGTDSSTVIIRCTDPCGAYSTDTFDVSFEIYDKWAIINIDRSGSMYYANPAGQSRLERARLMAHAAVDSLLNPSDPVYPGEYKIAVMHFNADDIRLEQIFTSDAILLHTAIDSIVRPRHDTPLAAAMCLAHCILPNNPVGCNSLLLTYTDGKENESQNYGMCPPCDTCDKYFLTGWNYDCEPLQPATCTYWQICIFIVINSGGTNLIHYFGAPINPFVKGVAPEDMYFLQASAEESGGIFTYYSDAETFCGDANSDGQINVSDAVYIINYIFSGGEPPASPSSGDSNCDGEINVSDVVWLINYVFLGESSPCDLDGDGTPDC